MQKNPNELSIFNELTSGQLAGEFNTFTESQILAAHRKTANDANSKILKFAQFLKYEYSFENLILADEQKRDLFAFGMAQCWLFTRTNDLTSSYFWSHNCFITPLSIILNTEYQLNIDEVSIIEQVTRKKVADILSPAPSKNEIDYGKRFSQWGFLRDLFNAPFCDLKTLVLMANVMSLQTRLLSLSRIWDDKCVDAGIDNLEKRGLVILDVPKANLLANFSLDTVKKFALENCSGKIPSRKNDLINFIKENCDPQIISAFLNSFQYDPQYEFLTKEIFVLPTFPNTKIFQEYIRSELNRLTLYLEYVSCIEFKLPTIISTVPKPNQPGKRPGDHFQNLEPYDNNQRAYSPSDSIESITPHDLRIIQKYWDTNCDALARKVEIEHPNSFPINSLVAEVLSYWGGSGLLSEYKKETYNSSFKTHWNWLLNSYATFILGSEENYQLKSTELICNGCGQQFREWSLPIFDALRVNKEIEFCYSCYSYIFGHSFRANTTEKSRIPENIMLLYLFEFSKALGFIPTRTFMENVELPLQSTEKQIETGKLLLKMPAYDIYIEKFSNWLQCLTLAGVLDDGHRKTSRGIQCLANDGHLCLSLGEKAIDDWLSSHNIAHEKESLYPFDEDLNPNKLSRTDWKIGNTFIEYAGLMTNQDYANKMKRKKLLTEKSGIILLVIEPVDLFTLDEKLSMLFPL